MTWINRLNGDYVKKTLNSDRIISECEHCHRPLNLEIKPNTELKCPVCGKVLMKVRHFSNKKDHTGVRSDKSSQPHFK